MPQSTATTVKPSRARKAAQAPATTVPEQNRLDTSLSAVIQFFSSLKVTVVCLTLWWVLVFLGTLAHVELGLYQVQNDFFRSFFVYLSPKGASLRSPVFPGGYLIGGVLLINLVTAHFTRFKWSKKK